MGRSARLATNAMPQGQRNDDKNCAEYFNGQLVGAQFWLDGSNGRTFSVLLGTEDVLLRSLIASYLSRAFSKLHANWPAPIG